IETQMYCEGCLGPEYKVNITNPVCIGAARNIPGKEVTCLCVEGGFSILPACIISGQVVDANRVKLWRTLTRDDGAATVDARNFCPFSACLQNKCHIGSTETRHKAIGNERTQGKCNT